MNTVAGSIDAPAWGLTHMRSLSLGEVAAFESISQEDHAKALAYLVCHGVCDESGKRIFQDDDIAQILDIPAQTVMPVAIAIAKQIGITASVIDDAKKN